LIFKCCGIAVWRRNAPFWIYVADLQIHAGKIILYFNVLFITNFLFIIIIIIIVVIIIIIIIIIIIYLLHGAETFLRS
jgi:hypothetical protein